METYFSMGDKTSGFVATVCRQIMLEDPLVNPAAENVAQRLGISTRTMRRRLSDEGFTFNDAKNLARERRAKYLLVNSRASLTEIAFELGYRGDELARAIGILEQTDFLDAIRESGTDSSFSFH